VDGSREVDQQPVAQVLRELLDQRGEGVVVEIELAREGAERDATTALQERPGLLHGLEEAHRPTRYTQRQGPHLRCLR